MKLTHLSARDVFGYLNFEITFNPDLTFLTGINGSGKTTVLRLIMALLKPSFKELASIPFSKAELKFEISKGPQSLIVERRKNNYLLKVSSISKELQFNDDTTYSDQFDFETEMRIQREKGIIDSYSIFEEKMRQHPVMKFLVSLDTPLFLGLERGHMLIERFLDHEPRSRRAAHDSRIVGLRAGIEGTLGRSLSEILEMVRERYKDVRERQGLKDAELREWILQSAFEYISVESAQLTPPRSSEIREVIERRNEIEGILRRIGISQTEVVESLNTFFSKLEARAKYQESMYAQKPEIYLEWLVNKPQVDRITRLLEEVGKHKKEMEESMRPINDFLSLVNRFFHDSGKSVIVDAVGTIGVDVEGHESRAINALSSGERQILVILGHLSFNEQARRAGIFMVDEPELSLHLKWQEIFVESIMEASPSTQIILATHSPDIVSKYDRKAFVLRG